MASEVILGRKFGSQVQLCNLNVFTSVRHSVTVVSLQKMIDHFNLKVCASADR